MGIKESNEIEVLAILEALRLFFSSFHDRVFFFFLIIIVIPLMLSLGAPQMRVLGDFIFSFWRLKLCFPKALPSSSI